MTSLDDIDRRLIDALQRDGRASYADLPNSSGSPPRPLAYASSDCSTQASCRWSVSPTRWHSAIR